MKNHPLTVLIVLIGSAAHGAGTEDSVVKITATKRFPSPSRPWTKQAPIEVSGSGVVIAGNRILTCAHLVSYAQEVAVQGREGGRRVEAKVEAIGIGIDLAILTPIEPEFLAGRPQLPITAATPEAMVTVHVYGYPIGGSGLSVTKGIVSRIGFAAFDRNTFGLRVQVDAAINPGNSGGPALVDGKMVGLAFAHLDEGEGISFILPNEEIQAFIEDIKDGRYDGKPRLSGQYQILENPALRDRLSLPRDAGGIMVRRPPAGGVGEPLREFDVLTHIGERPIDREGTVLVRDGLRLPFPYLIPGLSKGPSVPVRVWRDGKARAMTLPVGRDDPRLIRELDGRDLPYFLYGPLAFSPVVADAAPIYLRINPGLITKNSPILVRSADRVRFAGEELVVVTSPLLAHRVARGYEDPAGQVVESVDGVPIRNLLHLVETLRDGNGEYVTIRFAEDDTEILSFRRREIEAATAEVMSENGIPRRGTPEVMTIWEKKAVISR